MVCLFYRQADLEARPASPVPMAVDTIDPPAEVRMARMAKYSKTLVKDFLVLFVSVEL